MRWIALTVVAACLAVTVVVPLAGAVMLGMLTAVSMSSDPGCGDGLAPGASTQAPIMPTSAQVGEYGPHQLGNAAQIVAAGRALDLDDWTITVGIMTAMGESDLVNIEHGDQAGPDSRGLFQQRANGAWGSYTDRMTPSIAATNFFRALLAVPDYRQLEPTIAAHRTQRNANPYHYRPYWGAALTVYAALTGTQVADLTATTRTGAACATPGLAQAGTVDPSCPGGDVSGYPNGQIPTGLLCPLWGTSDHQLRADAAATFNQMSQAYATAFGGPICVTDSYRPYADQVRLKAAKPRLAATPGTSNHGWARATDLCGGIQNFNTPQHRWMQANAPTYGWCDPGWARASGSKPEPWHWEFSPSKCP